MNEPMRDDKEKVSPALACGATLILLLSLPQSPFRDNNSHTIVFV
jgi:hypothetical protein